MNDSKIDFALRHELKRTSDDLTNCLFAISSATTLIKEIASQDSTPEYLTIIEKYCIYATALSDRLEKLIDQ